MPTQPDQVEVIDAAGELGLMLRDLATRRSSKAAGKRTLRLLHRFRPDLPLRRRPGRAGGHLQTVNRLVEWYRHNDRRLKRLTPGEKARILEDFAPLIEVLVELGVVDAVGVPPGKESFRTPFLRRLGDASLSSHEPPKKTCPIAP
jgi:hypothetical protein